MGITIGGGGGGNGSDLSPNLVTLGTGDNLNYGAVTTTGDKFIASSGTTAAPDTSLDPLVKIQRKISIAGASVAGDGVDECSGVASYVFGDAANEVQPVGLFGHASNAGTTNPEGTPAPDAVGVYGAGRITGSGIGTAIGAYLSARVDSASGKLATIELQSYNGTGSDHTVEAAGFSNSQAMWIAANGGNRSGAGIVFGNPFSKQFETGIMFTSQNTGPVLTASIRDDSTSATAIAINGTHATAAILVGENSGHIRIGGDAAITSGAKLKIEVTASTTPTTPALALTATSTNNTHFIMGNASGHIIMQTSGGADHGLTGTVAGDVSLRINTASKSFHIGGTVSTIEVTRANELGFFNDATPATKQTVTGSRGGNAALASLLTALAAYGLVTDSSS